MARLLEIACLQTEAYASAEDALQHALVLATEAVASGAKLLVLPEYAGGLKTEGRAFAPPVYNQDEHPVVQGLASFAEKHGVWIVLGSVAVPGPSDLFFNRSFVIDDTGSVRSTYDKIHLFDISLSSSHSYKESMSVMHGKSAALIKTPFATLGLSICYDLRFPQLYRDLAQAGAEILLVPAAFTKKTGQMHWHILNQARAIENGAFVVSPCAVGPVEGGGESYGHSLIIDPLGVIVAEGGEGTGVVQAQIDLNKVAETRAGIPSLQHDKPYDIAITNLELTT